MTDSDKEEQRLENIRTEYGAISAKLNQLPSFRFALAGFYLAAVGVIASRAKPAGVHFILLIGLTLVLWLIDLRTRALLANISNRGKQIETRDWGYAGWITGMNERDPETVPWFFWHIKLSPRVRHSFGFDLMFLGVMAYSIYQLLTV